MSSQVHPQSRAKMLRHQATFSLHPITMLIIRWFVPFICCQPLPPTFSNIDCGRGEAYKCPNYVRPKLSCHFNIMPDLTILCPARQTFGHPASLSVKQSVSHSPVSSQSVSQSIRFVVNHLVSGPVGRSMGRWVDGSVGRSVSLFKISFLWWGHPKKWSLKGGGGGF